MSVSSLFTVSNAIRIMVVGGLVALLLVLMQSCQQPKTGLDAFAKDSLKKLTVLEAPPVQPASSFSRADGAQMQLSDYKGKVILLNVWATWCAPCVAEMPSLDALQAAKGSERFEVVTVSLDRTTAEIEAFFKDKGLTHLEGWHDGTYGLSARLSLPGLPTSVFYNEHGREIARLPGEADWMSAESLALIDYLVE